MKKFYSFLIAAIIMLAIPMGMMGQTTSTYIFTTKSWTATLNGNAANWTSGQDGGGFSNNGIQVTTNSSGANGTSPISFTNVSKIVCTYNTNKSKGEGSIVAKIGDNSATTNSVAYSGSSNGTSANFTTEFNYTTPQSGKVQLTVNCTTNSIYLVSVAITTSGSSTPTTYTVSFDAGDGTFVGNTDFPNTSNTKAAGIYTLPSATPATGYTFDGWLLTGSSTPLTGSYDVSSDVAFTAQYTNSGSDITATLTASNLELTGSYTSDTEKTINGITYVYTDLMLSSERIQAKANSGTIKNATAYPGDIISVAITHNGTARATTINGSADGTTWTQVANGNGSLTADFSNKGYKYFQITRGSNAAYWTKIEITYSTSSSSLNQSDLAITDASTDLSFDLYTSATPQVIHYNTSSTGAITITPASPTSYFSYVHDATAKTITVTPLAVTPSAQTITIDQEADDDYYAGNISFTVSITNSDPNAPGTQNNPYTVPEALVAIDANMGITNVYVKGKVSEIVTPFDSQYGNITYNISIDGTGTAAQLQVYRGKSYNGEKFKTANEILVNDNVVVYGTLTLYHNNSTNTDTYEFNTGSQLVSNERTETKTITAHNGGTGGWNLIASPVASITPSAENGFITSNESDYDLYRFNQSATSGEWENWKQSGDHYHFNLVSGQGYLYASKNGANLTFSGTPYNGDGIFNLSYDENVSETGIKGLNLVGNPFSTNASVNKDFYEMNTEGSAVLATVSTSHTIAPMQGIFVKATATGETITFTPQTSKSNSRSAVVMNLSENSSVIDRAIVCINESRQLPKFQLFENSTKLYITQDNEDFAIVGAEAQGEMPVNFKAEKNGSYTISINAEDVEMNYLHLIDNMTGANVDLLTTPSYSFEAKTDDYASRFRLVFSAQGNANEGATESFAFISGNTFVLNNEGNATLQVIDMLGRVVSTEQVEGNVAHNVPANAGVYVLRLTNGNDVKTQKIVVR